MNANNLINHQGGVFVPNRIAGLDLMRISLALLIYMFHSWMHFGCTYSYLTDFVSVGAMAMTGFFLLSGYSLRLVYGEQNLMEKHNIGHFYLKRILGIIPLYYFFSLLFVLLLGNESIVDNALLFPIEVLGLQTTFTSLFSVTHNGGTWFISCIILAYLIYPFLQTICQQISPCAKVFLLVLFIFLDIWAAFISHRFHTADIYDNPFYRILEFACGLLVADVNLSYDNKFLRLLRSWGVLVVLGIILVVGVSIIQYYENVHDYMLLNILVLPCFAIMLFSLGTLKMPYLEKSKTLGYLGKISYAFFLVQFFAWEVGKWCVNLIGYDHNWARIFITLIYCLLASVLAYEFVQKPIESWVKSRFLHPK